MEKVELRCAVYDEATVVSVKVKRHVAVYTLAEAIFYRLRYEKKYVLTPIDLNLRLASKNGKWLKEDGTLIKVLRGPSNPEYNGMNDLKSLDDAENFGPDFHREHDEIQVLVKLPRPWLTLIKETTQCEYVGMETKLVYRRFLNALAQELGMMYDFDYEGGIPIIEDVLCALENGKWEFRLENGKYMTATALSKLFEEGELVLIKFLKTRSSNWKEINNGRIPRTCSGKPCVVMPHYLYTLDRGRKLKQIAVKGNLVSSQTHLEVKDTEDRFMNCCHCSDSFSTNPMRGIQSVSSFVDVSQHSDALQSIRQERDDGVQGFTSSL